MFSNCKSSKNYTNCKLENIKKVDSIKNEFINDRIIDYRENQ